MTLKEFAESMLNATHRCIAEEPVTDLESIKNTCHSLVQELISFYQQEDLKQKLTSY